MNIKAKKVIRKYITLLICALLIFPVVFYKTETTAYAYTQDEIDAAKAWLSANGYSPTMSGAEAAYQDYLNGKFGSVGGEEETAPSAETLAPEAIPMETVPESNAEVVASSPVTEETAVVEETAMEETREEIATMEESPSELITEEESKEATEQETETSSGVAETSQMDETLEIESTQETLEESEMDSSKITVAEWLLIIGISLGIIALGGIAYYKRKR